MRLSVVLPAFNEAPNIQEAVREASTAAERLFDDHEIIVVDDGSEDRTAVLVEELAADDGRIRVVAHGQNRGYGEALRTGFLSARHEYVFFTDADLQFDMDELERFRPYVGTVDVVAGYRVNRQDPPLRRAMAAGWNLLVRVLFYAPVRDIDCAFKLFSRPVLSEVDLRSVGAMVNTELMVRLGRRGASIVEVGVHHRPRRAGQARGANLRVVLTAFRELWRMRAELTELDSRDL